jgi:hypothetical protein
LCVFSVRTRRKIHDANDTEPKTPERASLVVSGTLLCAMLAVAQTMMLRVGATLGKAIGQRIFFLFLVECDKGMQNLQEI